MKRVLKAWQLAVVAVLLVGMLSTMFMPAFSVNEKSMKKAFNVMGLDKLMNAAGALSGLTGGAGSDELNAQMDEYIKQAVDEFDKSAKEELGISIRNISPFTLMTKSLGSKDAKSDAKEDSKDKDSKEPNTTLLRVALWVVYVLAIVVLIVNILGYALKMNKFIPLGIDAAYGAISAGIFGYLKFGLPGTIASYMKGSLGDLGPFGAFISADQISKMAANMVKAFASFAFLAALIIAVVILLASIVFFFVGGAAEQAGDYYEEDNWDNGGFDGGYNDNGGYDDGGYEPMGMTNPEPEPYLAPAPEPTPAIPPVMPTPAPAPAPTPMGQVRCTKGIAYGQGFMLAADKKVVVGKSRNNANLLINNPNVSNVHCSIRYNPARNSYIVKDHSMNGTFVNGVRMQNNVPMELPAGTILSLADGSNEITLG